MCDLDYLEPFDFSCETEHKARKDYKCNLCGGPITKGQKYLKHVSKFEGQICSEKACTECIKDREAFSNAHEHVYTTPSCTKELIIECLHERKNFRDMLKWGRMLKRMDKRAELPPPPEKSNE